jgi:cyclophilin family peptidyl-prolyl cis-trans isomerase
MQRILLLGFLFLTFLSCNQDPHTYALISTEFGDMKVRLYEDTPIHRDNFVKLAKQGFYDSLLFHRVIQGFMIQGGDPQSKNAAPNAVLGMGGPGYELDSEIGRPHLYGALAAARTQNPQKRSSGSQFYIVQGRPVSEDILTRIEQSKGIAYNAEQKAAYAELGGTPQLDMDYTVFGEVVEGLDVLETIASQPTLPGDRPAQDIRMTVEIL